MSSNDLLLAAAAVTASATVAALTLIQTDVVSRAVLDPKRLQLKRAQEHAYKWQTALEKAHMHQNHFLAGGMGNFQSDPDCVALLTEYIRGHDELTSLAKRVATDKSTYFRVLRVDTDPHDPLRGYYAFLSVEDAARNAPDGDPELDSVPPSKMLQVPLAKFCALLRVAFDEQVTTTTMCFVADASSGAASGLIEQLVKESKTGVAVAPEPLWMASLAALTDQKEISMDVAENALYALCRLESWRLREMSKDSKTVLFTLPGQASTPILLPFLQRIFPEERHVFAYDGCAASLQRGMDQEAKSPRTPTIETLGACTSMSYATVRHTTPLVRRHITREVNGLTAALGKLPKKHAEGVETWMTSVDAFFQLKADETKNGYLPYVFKYKLLIGPGLSFEPQKGDAYWSLSSLLQFITGCRSRPLPEGVLDAATEWLKDYNGNQSEDKSLFSERQSVAIENCVFQHKSILIGNKTLQDTVLPKQHWTLKQASRKSGCACCAPEEEEEEDDEQQGMPMPIPGGGKVDMNVPGAFAVALGNNTKPNSTPDRPKYVDGKMGFAFDPSKFS